MIFGRLRYPRLRGACPAATPLCSREPVACRSSAVSAWARRTRFIPKTLAMQPSTLKKIPTMYLSGFCGVMVPVAQLLGHSHAARRVVGGARA